MAIQLHHDVWGRLVFTDESGAEHIGVDPVRAFPISAQNQGISILDSEGRELFWIDDLENVEPAFRGFLEDELNKRHFLPRIQKIHSIHGLSETVWDVTTDRGRTKFTLKNEEEIRRIVGTRVMITDGHGIRYLILDYRRLDSSSLRFLERFI